MYEKTIEACLRREASQWEIGDALIEECGKPSKKGDNDDSYAKIKAVAKELESKGIDYSFNTLRVMRETSFAWANDTRLSFSWSVHRLFNEHQKVLRDWCKKYPEETMTVATAQNLLKERQEAREKREQKAAEKAAETDNEDATTVDDTSGEVVEDTQFVPDETTVEPVPEKIKEVVTFSETGEELWAATNDLSIYLKDHDLNGEADAVIKMAEDIRDKLNELLSLVRPKRKGSKPRVAVDNTPQPFTINMPMLTGKI